MHIDRSNYLEFFLLYIDRELSAGQREALNDFIRQHPDLENELQQLNQFILVPDEEIIFTNKESLLHQTTEPFITSQNIGSFFVMYADNELTNQHKAAVELFVYRNPQFQAEFELIQKIRLYPDPAITFTHKESLFRHEKPANKTLTVRWWNIAAACIILLISILWLVKHTGDQSPDQVADTQQDIKLIQPHHNIETQNSDENKHGLLPKSKLIKEKTAGKYQIAKTPPIQDAGFPGIKQNHPLKNPAPMQDRKNFTFSGNLIVDSSTSDGGNNIAKIKIAPAMSENYDRPADRQVSNEPEIETNIVIAEEKPDNVYFANLPLNNKHFFRGIYRKASRFIDKKTGFLDTEKTGVRFGNVEIAIQ